MEIQNLEDFGRSLSSKEVADLLGVSVTTLYSVAEEFGGVRVGKKYVFFEKVFFEMLKGRVLNEKVCNGLSVPPSTLPGFDVAQAMESLKSQAPVEDRHGIFG